MYLKTKKYIFISVIILTVAFIWSNSLKVGDDSMNQSNFIKELIVSFFSNFGINLENTFFIDFIRKFAHFFEYFILGLELAIYKNIFHKSSKKASFIAVLIGVLVGCVDETIQLIPSLQRSGEILDALIDCAGVLVAWLVVNCVYKLCSKKNS